MIVFGCVYYENARVVVVVNRICSFLNDSLCKKRESSRVPYIEIIHKRRRLSQQKEQIMEGELAISSRAFLLGFDEKTPRSINERRRREPGVLLGRCARNK